MSSQLSIGIRPLYDQVIIRPADQVKQTPGGIIIPENAKAENSVGIVVAVGSGQPDNEGNPIPLAVKYGDRVFYRRGAGTELKKDDTTYRIMDEDHILAVFDD